MRTLSELQTKDIVVVEDGKRLGHLSDLEIDVDTGSIQALVIGLKGKVMGLFGSEEEIIIPWNHILTIGEDVILVKKVQQPTLYLNQVDHQQN
ncbi:YlmC/YmxH family sporulation protein [Aquibacillus sp. 3ASR75-11]|uniref:YlmC/YmxH family sporulation protein n=1 Tax=Terrihalobacillus insolitus TaxID=2950438 RepID=A0A9X3WPZ7_9BACI|nr:YlmC/YmxH family sporulation protein [Terrihalobacillus insolitus]MDC3412844.1 YlmC/YmxH family sporulation protein [Terrihalobacillus insolitus]MDC3423680.1 YlmC/YmxH family sporulation protein [Terrihalobacillus insolitus]